MNEETKEITTTDDVIDLWGDGANLTVQKLMQRAGITGELSSVIDFPCNGVLSRSPSQNSHAHVEWKREVVQGPNEMSVVGGMAPATMMDEPEPSDTDSPFHRFNSDLHALGMFGEAMRSYCDTRAILLTTGNDVDALESWFCYAWGANPEEMRAVNAHVPMLRSSGSAMWGGLGAKLSPALLALPATQAAMSIKFHGHHRQHLGHSLLIDWPRLKAVIGSVGLQLMVEDDVCRVARLDFLFDVREFPTAPTECVLNFGATSFPEVKASRELFRKAIDYFDHMKAVKMDRLSYYSGKVLEFEDSSTMPKLAFYKIPDTARITSRYMISDYTLDQKETDVEEFTRKRLEIKRPPLHVSQGLKSLAICMVMKNLGAAPRSIEVMSEIAALTICESTNSVHALCNKWITQYYPVDTLVKLIGLGNGSGLDLGWKWVSALVQLGGLKDGVMQETNLRKMWNTMLASMTFRHYILEVLAKAIATIDRQHAPAWNISLLKDLAQTDGHHIVLEKLIFSRRRFWANRYLRTANGLKDKEGRADERVLYQVMSKVFNGLRVRIAATGQIDVVESSLVNAFVDSAKNFVKQRMVKADRKGVYVSPCPINKVRSIMRGDLDLWCYRSAQVALDPTYATIYDKVLPRMSEFVQDVRTIISDFSENTFSPLNGDDEYGGLDLFEVEGGEQVWLADEKPVPISVTKIVEDVELLKNQACEDDFDDFEMSEVIYNPNPQLDLAGELREDFQGIGGSLIVNVVNQHGSHVNGEQYEAICLQVKKAIYAESSNISAVEDVEDF